MTSYSTSLEHARTVECSENLRFGWTAQFRLSSSPATATDNCTDDAKTSALSFSIRCLQPIVLQETILERHNYVKPRICAETRSLKSKTVTVTDDDLPYFTLSVPEDQTIRTTMPAAVYTNALDDGRLFIF